MKSAAPHTQPKAAVNPGMDRQSAIEKGLAILRKEAQAIVAAADRLNESFVQAVDLLLNCRGRVAVTGMGKAGLIGNEIEATLSSTATAA